MKKFLLELLLAFFLITFYSLSLSFFIYAILNGRHPIFPSLNISEFTQQAIMLGIFALAIFNLVALLLIEMSKAIEVHVVTAPEPEPVRKKSIITEGLYDIMHPEENEKYLQTA